jgi:AcrR family transcriptional regulator
MTGARSWTGVILLLMSYETSTIYSGGEARPNGRWYDVREAALTLFAERGYRATSMKDIAESLGVKAPALYNHVASKEQILREIMSATMDRCLIDHREAVSGTDDVVEQLRRAAEAHARLPIRYRREILVTNREILNLDEDFRPLIVAKRDEYEQSFRSLIERGRKMGVFVVESPRLVSYAILEMGNGIAVWFRKDGSLTEEDVVRQHGEFALKLVDSVRR